MRGALHQAMQQGHSPDQALHEALHTLNDQRGKWAALLAAIAAATGVAASANLISQFQDAGTLPDDYSSDYDPSTDPDSALYDYIHSDTPANAGSIVDDTRAKLFDVFKDAIAAGSILALLDALDGQYETWGAGQQGSGSGGATTVSDAQTATVDAMTDVSGRAGVLATNAVTQPWGLAELDTASDVTASDNPDAPTDESGQQLIAVKTWVCSMLPNSREWHVEADGQQVALDAQFEVDGDMLDGPGDGDAHQANNCCCSMLMELVPATYALDSETGGE